MEKLTIFKGAELSFPLPCGTPITIREQSASDDDILSRVQKGDQVIGAINNFILAITLEFNGKKGMTLEEVVNLKLKSKYYILLKSRIHSIGNEMDFEHTCNDGRCEHVTYNSINLSEYDDNMESPTEGGNKNKITPYESKAEPSFEFTLPSGKVIRMDYLNGAGEKYILQQATNGNISRNTELFARNISVKVEGEFVKLSSLNILSKKESISLYGTLAKHDPQFMLGADVKCERCQANEFIPFISIPDFFFPAEK